MDGRPLGTRVAPAAHARPRANVIEQTLQLKLPSRVESVAEAAEAASLFAGRLGLGDDAAFALDMAVRESVTNAVLHGNRRDERKQVEVGFEDAGDQLIVTVRDEGEGFDPAAVSDPTAPENLLKASGRGILFMRSFMDTVEWEQHPAGGTVVRMTKKK